ncbi:hypothetical protein PR202_ga22360 [Eleusine coracana subsp. coracana]|uniref:ARM repeat superfamily protein n=1 Tax=Eleusine coracana subsp. coracana TaxID=191504 RepID=A0AAV5D351_ELECO|nr:hypothetical protein PR202_ga22360 [Eleusine coracana subsp. coracana]
MPPPDSGDPSLADCLRLLDEVPAAAASSPAFRRHWPSISASLATLSAALSSPTFPPAAPAILPPLAAALEALLSVAAGGARRLGHLHTVSLVSSSAAALAQLAADARVLAAPPASAAASGQDGIDGVVARLRVGSAASRAAALEDLVSAVGSSTLPPSSSSSSAVAAVAALLDSGDLLPSSRDRAVSILAAFASSSDHFLTHESAALLPHLCRALESSAGPTAEHACVALLPLTSASRDASAAVATRGGLVALGTPRAQETALACLRNLTAGGDSDDAQRLRVDAFQDGALACVKDFLEYSDSSDGPGRAAALGLLRNLAAFRYVAEAAASSGFVGLVAAALLTTTRPATRTEAALALAELCGAVGPSSKWRKELPPDGPVVPRLVSMMEAKPVSERDAAARALAALLLAATSSSSGGGGGGYRKAFRKEERGVVNAVQMLDPAVEGGVDKRFPVAVLLAVAPSRRCRKQMVAAGACGFLQGLVDGEVEGAKKLAECLGKGKMLGVFPRT